MTRLERLALLAYPPSFRARYGPELDALVEDLPPAPGTVPDLVRGAARAWLRPVFTGPRGVRNRLQATVSTTWVAWCAGFLVAPAVSRAVLDPPVPGATHAVRLLLDAAFVLFFVGWGLALLGAAPLVVRYVWPALRGRDRASLRPLVPAVGLGVAEGAGLLVIGMTRAGQAGHQLPAAVAGVIVWMAGAAMLVACVALGPPLALRRLGATDTALRAPSWASVPVALSLALLTGCSLAAAALAGNAELVSSSVPVIAALTIACLASLVALASAGRGVRALRVR